MVSLGQHHRPAAVKRYMESYKILLISVNTIKINKESVPGTKVLTFLYASIIVIIVYRSMKKFSRKLLATWKNQEKIHYTCMNHGTTHFG